jgi:outer membrane lipoprotein SlyB
MAKKEDNRDVFEKALDYAPVVGGAVVGGVVGRKIAGRAGKKHRQRYGEQKRNQDEIQDAYDSAPPGYWDDKAIGNPLSSGEVSRVRRVFGFSKDKNAAAKMIGTVAGGAAGAATGGAYSESKRRK